MSREGRKVYEVGSDRGGYLIRATDNHWVVHIWSRMQGTKTGRIIAVSYNEEFPKGTNLKKKWNEGMTYGAALYHYALLHGEQRRKGFLVR